MKRVRDFFTKNIHLKLVSLVLSVLMWFLVTNINDPSTVVTFYNIPVTIRNTSLITNQGKVYQVLDGTDMISRVEISAPRSVADTFSRDNVVATADMSNLSSLDTLSINVTTNKYASEVEYIIPSIDTVKLSIEDSRSKMLPLTATPTGTIADGYIIGQITTDQNVLRITGPATAVDSVKSATVTVDVTGFTSSIDMNAEVELRDANGEKIVDSAIAKNITTVGVNVGILQTKRVPLAVEVVGSPADGFVVIGEAEVNPSTVLIAGRESAIRGVESITLSHEAFDVTGLSDSLATSINIKSMLPNGISLGDSDFSGQVTVTIPIDRVGTKELTIPLSQVTIKNIPSDMSAKIQSEAVEGQESGIHIKVRGLPDKVDSLEAADIKGAINVDELIERLQVTRPSEGAYTVPVEFELPDGVTLSETVRVLIYLEENSGE